MPRLAPSGGMSSPACCLRRAQREMVFKATMLPHPLSIPLALPGLSRQGCWRAHPRPGILAAIYKAISMSLSNPLFLPWQQVPKVHYLPCPEVLSFICLKLNLSLFSIECPSFFHDRIWRMTVLRPAYPLPSGFPNPQPNPPSAFSTSAWQAAPSPTRDWSSFFTERLLSLPVDASQGSPAPGWLMVPSGGCSQPRVAHS